MLGHVARSQGSPTLAAQWNQPGTFSKILTPASHLRADEMPMGQLDPCHAHLETIPSTSPPAPETEPTPPNTDRKWTFY